MFAHKFTIKNYKYVFNFKNICSLYFNNIMLRRACNNLNLKKNLDIFLEIYIFLRLKNFRNFKI